MDNKKITVFLLEDHNLVRQALRRLLEAGGVEVVGEAANGEDAVVQIKQLKPRIAIVDLSLPGRSGIDVTREIVAAKRTRVLILSMYADEEHLRRALEAGATGYVLKDTSSEDLVKAVQTVSNGDAFFSPKVATFIAASHRGASPRSAGIKLSPREREILRLIALGKTGKEIALSLDIAPGTVETHRRRLMSKLGLGKVAELTLYAVRQGIVSPDRP
jgi:DNA-binding NarL/FixJ family response regulator